MSTDAIIQQKLRQCPTYKSLTNAFMHISTHDKNATVKQQPTDNSITDNHIAQNNTTGIVANNDNVDQDMNYLC